VPPWYGLNVWCGLDRDPARARELLAGEMQQLYQLPYTKFERLAPVGTPAQVADWLQPYAEAGCSLFTLVARSSSWQAGADYAGEVSQRLAAACR